ncbi:MAG: SIMPL domain-containing protein [Planctomycetes bacterium]|nr:SIMPL domain-containing protein [Planctomycetota bacterium]
MRQSLLNATLLLGVLAMVSAATAADERDPARIISVTGEGRVSAPPDMASIHTGVVTQAETAKQALEQNNSAMQKLMETLKQHNIAEKDVQTSGFNVSPVYRQDERGRREPEVTAYRVQNQVRIRVRNLPELGMVLDALVQAGSNQISGISFDVDDPAGILNQARSRAIRDARSRADVYAQAAGVKVGRVRQISEQPVHIPQPFDQRRMMFAGEAASRVPVATGEQDFTVTVHVVYELEGT